MKRFLQRTVGIAAAALLLPFATAGQAVLAETTADTAVCHAYTGTTKRHRTTCAGRRPCSRF